MLQRTSLYVYLYIDMHVFYQATRRGPTFLGIDVVEMVVTELHARLPIGRVELVRNVPAQWSELPSLLHYRVHERHAIEHGLPLRQVADVQKILRDS